MTRSRLLRSSLAAFAGAVFFVSAAHAAAPQARNQAPGFHRMMLGDFEVTALSDGTLAHVAFPGLGRVRAEARGYVWIPLNYSGMK